MAPSRVRAPTVDNRGGDVTDKIILDLCGGTGAWSRPYAEAGYDVRVITLPEYDVRTYQLPENVYGILAAPPCTEFTRERTKSKIPRNPEAGMIIVKACLKIINYCNPTFYVIENPEGYLKDYLGKPDFIFHPWYFGNPWTKKTALWGRFRIPKIQYFHWATVPKIKELYVRPGRPKPSIVYLHKSSKKYIPEYKNLNIKTDAEFRAITPPGFAQAFYEANP